MSIISQSSSKEEMLWYVDKTYENKWSKNKVDNQFEARAYQKNKLRLLHSTFKSGLNTCLYM